VKTHYNKKRARADEILEEGAFEQTALLEGFCRRLCAAPFITKPDTIALWLELWPHFSDQERQLLTVLPDPCLKHVESRMGKDKRAEQLRSGAKRLIDHDSRLFLEGLRLFPHAVCRTAEAIGPLDGKSWSGLEKELRNHRLWLVKSGSSEEEFWQAAELLQDHRELPQPVLDFLDHERPKENAPVQEFQASLTNYLLRARIEKVRLAAYQRLRCHHPVGSNQ